jgi:hypothetical protein
MLVVFNLPGKMLVTFKYPEMYECRDETFLTVLVDERIPLFLCVALRCRVPSAPALFRSHATRASRACADGCYQLCCRSAAWLCALPEHPVRVAGPALRASARASPSGEKALTCPRWECILPLPLACECSDAHRLGPRPFSVGHESCSRRVCGRVDTACARHGSAERGVPSTAPKEACAGGLRGCAQ